MHKALSDIWILSVDEYKPMSQWTPLFFVKYSADSPLLWIRIDPDMSILRKVEFEQADFMWQYQLRYERDVVAQVEAISALEKFPTPASRLALTDILEQDQCFYKVRMQACYCLAKVKHGSWVWKKRTSVNLTLENVKHYISVLLDKNEFDEKMFIILCNVF